MCTAISYTHVKSMISVITDLIYNQINTHALYSNFLNILKCNKD